MDIDTGKGTTVEQQLLAHAEIQTKALKSNNQAARALLLLIVFIVLLGLVLIQA
jgi:hypothetical protein